MRFLEKVRPFFLLLRGRGGLIEEWQRTEVMPLVYGALDSDNAVILEKALKVVPGLAENLDYTVSEGVLTLGKRELIRKTDGERIFVSESYGCVY